MNVNDIICVGAEPIALVDYLAVEQSDPERLGRDRRAACASARRRAGIEIPGGELAVLPELIRGHPSPARLRPVRRVHRHRRARRDRHRRGDRARRRARRPAVDGPALQRLHARPPGAAVDGGSASTTGPPSWAGRPSPTCCSSRRSSTCARCSSCCAPTCRSTASPTSPAAASTTSSACATTSPTASRTRCPVPPVFGLVQRLGERARRRRCGGSSTWAAGSSASCPRSAADEAAAACSARHHAGGRGGIGRARPDRGRARLRRRLRRSRDVARRPAAVGAVRCGA